MRLIRIGRADFNEVRLSDPSVSRRHAELIVLPDGRLYLTDCNSTAGTFVSHNGEHTRIRQGFIPDEARVNIGPIVFETFELVS